MNSDNENMVLKYRQELGNWIRSYSKITNGKDWNYCVGLTYGIPVKSYKITRRKLYNFYNYLFQFDNSIYGFYVNEYDKSFYSLHNHLLIASDLNESDFKYHVIKYWKKIGVCDVMKYSTNGNYANYMTKHVSKTSNNEWDFFNN